MEPAVKVPLGILKHGWDVTLVAGSRTDLGRIGDATRFYAGLDVRPVSFDDPELRRFLAAHGWGEDG